MQFVGSMLADAEAVKIGLMIVNMVMSVLLGLGLYWIGAKARRFETLEKSLSETTAKLIEERMRAMTHEFNGHMQPLICSLDEMRARIKESEGDFRGLGERDQRIELSLAGKVDGLKDYIRENAASRTDLEAHEASVERKVERLEGHIAELAKAVAVLNDRGSVPAERKRATA